MIPTLFAIAVIVFALINAAPGTPGGDLNSSGNQQANESANAREGYRLFKEQYNLDKPVLLNFRSRLTRSRVERELETIARNMGSGLLGEVEARLVAESVAGTIGAIANADYNSLQSQLADPDLDDTERQALQTRLQNMAFVDVQPPRPSRPPQGRVFRAEERVENWGQDIVPFLVTIANEYLYAVEPDTDDRWNDGRAMLARDVGLAPEESLAARSVTRDGTSYEVNALLTRKVRFLAAQRLSVNARRRLLIRPGERGTDEEIERNRAIQRENNEISDWTWEMNATDDEILAVNAQWLAWHAEHHERWERNFGQQVARIFLDTRFALYMGKLLPFSFKPNFHFRAPDLGTSMRFRRPVNEVIGEHWRYSILLSVISLLLAYFISVPLGVLGAVKQGHPIADRGIGIALFVLYSLPAFFVATLLQTYLTKAKGIDLFPVSDFQSGDPMGMTMFQNWKDVLWHLVLPVICLTYASLAVLSRYARTGLLDVVRSDYIRTARAKGLPEWIVIIKHAVRNGMIPILTLLGTTLPVLIGGSIVIEYIFSIDGMGALMLQSILQRDYNVMMGVLLISAVLTLFGILASDISYALVDPRINFD